MKKAMDTYCVSCKKNTEKKKKIQMSEKLNKIDNGFIKLCFFWQKNQILLKSKNSTSLVIFQMISLKLKKNH